ncbi:MAG: polysaccharide lyase [Nitrososphaera sp.]|nr:polysaccharide lyase [Nitrososphaera sp.]
MRHLISKNIVSRRFFVGALFAVFWAVTFLVPLSAFAVTPNQNPVKIFSDDFESGNFSKWTDCGNNAIETGIVHAGTKSMRYTHQGCYKNLSQSSREVYYKFYWYFPTGFTWNLSSTGGKHFWRIAYSTGSNSLFTNQIDSGATQGIANSFGMAFFPGNGGPGFNNIAPLPEGRWFKWEFYVRLNDPGVANGETAIWVDGVETFRRTNIDLKAQSNALNLLAQVTNYDSCSGVCHWYMDDVELWNGCPSGTSCKAGSTTLAPPSNLKVVP